MIDVEFKEMYEAFAHEPGYLFDMKMIPMESSDRKKERRMGRRVGRFLRGNSGKR